MVEGIKALNKKLTVSLPRRLEEATRLAMEKSAEELVSMMKRLAPIDTGDLQISISWTWGDAPAGSVVVAKSAEDERGLKITIYAGSKEAYYARWVEFGTKNQSAHPYFYPAYRSLRKRIKSRTTRAMKKAIKEESADE